MKKRLLLLLLTILSLATATYAGEVEQVKALVYKWNGLHNTREVEEFKKLYASEVLFYGRYNSRYKCYTLKRKFLTPDFHQEIVSPIEVTYYSSGTIKCSFTKEVTFKAIVKKHKCYLLVKEPEKRGDYLITGESDLQTDINLKVKLDLGEELSSTNNSTSLYIILALVALAGGGIAYFFHKRRKQEPVLMVPANPVAEEPIAQPIAEPQPVLNEQAMVEKVKTAILEEMKAALPQKHPSKVKGDAFEKYVVERFNKDYFRLIEWRSDKYHEGHFAESSMLPDLVFLFEHPQTASKKFAVECKWRAGFINGKIEWASRRQMNTYKQYERKDRVPVFVIIGVGGEPSNPDSFYVVPLKKINSHYLKSYELKPYEKKDKGSFYLNTRDMTLS